MNKEHLLQRVSGMIMSSTYKPKYAVLSSAKIANLMDTTHTAVEKGLQELVAEGRLQRSVLSDSPHYQIYLLPGQEHAEVLTQSR
ncbi:hypothetical protein [Ectobacillus ponti]|uniref:Uncharacterized protein n=1 Tax=Ectobacillus ponti TaxID=2961894 RepID=A0AA41XA75_9BACI|nr:hypothetical protein [Ectobacillus ponti]MCP8969574.1 hypothetical protein [Ectobacillus ponti]